MSPTFRGHDVNSSSPSTSSVYSPFSHCNSDRSGSFSSPDHTHLLLVSCASDDLLLSLVSDLDPSRPLDLRRRAALDLRLLTKNNPDIRSRIARAGAVKPLVSLISSSDPQLQEYCVTSILNLSLCDDNKGVIVSSGAIRPLVRALRSGTATTRANAACALLWLSQAEENKAAIGRAGAVLPLVELLERGTSQGKKDAATALYSLCSIKENKVRAVQAGIMRPLVELMADLESNMVDKAAYVASVLAGGDGIQEARIALVEEGGVPVLVEMVEVGTPRQKEIAALILLPICKENAVHRRMVVREGAIPPLVALSQSGTTRGKQKAEALVGLLRQPVSGGVVAASQRQEFSQ
ncbi:hypothetical protein MLD38_034849 [Melastoma candidum]|uniref:Uncharacterized protein n=1 Tax=Melastoma candidum TaxID=119954 RepID=A0ACB9MD25_9MYRT|nr:hypothetical protein MLD38_034849 [Melastoma candidum]